MLAMKLEDEHFSQIDKTLSIREHQNKTDLRIERMLSRLDAQHEMMKFGFEQMNERFKQMNERFKQMDERFNQMQLQMDKRFEQVDKRFEQMEIHFRWYMGISISFSMAIIVKLFFLI